MSHYFQLDPTTLVIMMPVFVLSCLLLAASRLKRIPFKLSQQSVVCLVLLLVHATIYLLCSRLFSWSGFLPTTLSAYSGALTCMFCNLLLSLLLMCPIVILTQSLVGKVLDTDSRKSRIPIAEIVVKCGVSLSFLPVAFPFLLYVVAMAYSDDFGLRLAREMFRVGVALATIPISFVGMGVAFYGYPLYRGSLSDLMLFRSGKLTTCVLNNKSHDELDKLIVAAVSLREFEVADWISSHLLQRYEQL